MYTTHFEVNNNNNKTPLSPLSTCMNVIHVRTSYETAFEKKVTDQLWKCSDSFSFIPIRYWTISTKIFEKGGIKHDPPLLSTIKMRSIIKYMNWVVTQLVLAILFSVTHERRRLITKKFMILIGGHSYHK